jgi:prophage regulatory protein
MLRKPEVRKITGLSDPSIDRKEQAGDFPKRRRLGVGRAVGWIDGEIFDWIARCAPKSGRVPKQDTETALTVPNEVDRIRDGKPVGPEAA